MQHIFWRNIVLASAAVGLVTSCGGVQPASDVSGVVPSHSAATQSRREHSWIKRQASSGSLLYVGGGQTYVLSYPGGQTVGMLDVSTLGMCSDNKGNVFLTNRNAVIEYAHGSSSPIRTLTIPGAETFYCSVDPTTNNLAVTFECQPCDGENLAIYQNEQGTPTRYEAPEGFTCGYDNQGNLFIAGSSGNELTELPKGSSEFTSITLSKSIGNGGQIQWDGRYMAFQNETFPGWIYRIKISGSTGTVMGATKFQKYIRWTNQSWVENGAVSFPFAVRGTATTDIGIWSYPRGKVIKIIKNLGGRGAGFNSVTVSVAPSH